MDKKAAFMAANEMPEGTQILYGDFSEGGGYYSCSYQPDVVYAQYGKEDSRLFSRTVPGTNFL